MNMDHLESLQYLRAKLDETLATIRANTGLDVGVVFSLHDSRSAIAETVALVTAAEALGWSRHKFSSGGRGGTYQSGPEGGWHSHVVVYDSRMPDDTTPDPALAEYKKLREQGLADMNAVAGAGGLS